MLMDIVKNIVVSQVDFDLVGEITGAEALQNAAGEVQADVIVLGALGTSESIAYEDLLFSRPRMKVVAITAGGREAVLHELQPRTVRLGEIAPATLIAAIRGAACADNASPSATQ
jgi:hypothetical protein